MGPRIPFLALAWVCLFSLALLLRPWSEQIAALLPSCAFHRWTGLPCLSCGLTRCLQALARGDLGGAFHWHPVGAALVLLSPVAAIWDLWRAIRGRPWPPLPAHWGWRAGVAAALALAWAFQLFRGL
ncbi:MAG: DUF2752 domain-containing protein [Acidobacteria bacterium]|nr:DUF2752 domain-containing protein [Acidobacteriota bacterium]